MIQWGTDPGTSGQWWQFFATLAGLAVVGGVISCLTGNGQMEGACWVMAIMCGLAAWLRRAL